MKSIFRPLIGSLIALPMIYALPASAQQTGADTSAKPIILAQKALTPEERAKLKAARQKKRQEERRAKRQQNRQNANPNARANSKGNNPNARANSKGNNPNARANQAQQQKRKAAQQKKIQQRKAAQQEKIQQRKADQQRKIQQRKANQQKKQRGQRAINEEKARGLDEKRLNAQQKRKQREQRQEALQRQRQNKAKTQRRQLEKREEALDNRAKQLQRRDRNIDKRQQSVNQQIRKRRQIQTRQVKRNQQTVNRLQNRRKNLASQINTQRDRAQRLERRNNRLARQRNWLLNQRRTARRTYRRNFAWRERARVVDRRRDRTIFTALAGAAVGAAIVGSYYVYHNDSERLYGWRARDVYVDDLNNGWTRNVVVRPDGTRVVTIRDVDGFIVRRYRVYPNNRISVLFDNRPVWWDEGDLAVEVAPVRYTGPRSRYIVEPAEDSIDDVYDAVIADPINEIDRTYTLQQVLVNRNLRDYMPRIDMDTIRFATGSAEIPDGELDRLDAVAAAMEAAIKENPEEVYLIEGHTDAVGDREDNLILSDERASSVAKALTEYYDIPPENLVTQGYGEQFLKVETDGSEQRNRRVAIRRITPLLANDSEDIALDDDGNEIFQN